MTDVEAAIGRSAGGIDQARWSVSVVDLETGRSLGEWEPDANLATASIGKLLVLVELAARARSGEFDLRTVVTRSDADHVGDSGLWQHMLVDELCLADLASLVGAVSDNLATNVLLRHLGLEAVQRRAEALGLRAVRLHDMVRDRRTADDPPHLSTGSGRELAGLLRRLWLDEADEPRASVGGRVLGWLRPGTDLSMVAAALGLDPLAHTGPDRGVRLCNKTGTDIGVRADVGIVDGPRGRVAYAVLVNWPEPATEQDRSRDRVLDAMRQIGAAIRSLVVDGGTAGDER